jgi:hypothetical protein
VEAVAETTETAIQEVPQLQCWLHKATMAEMVLRQEQVVMAVAVAEPLVVLHLQIQVLLAVQVEQMP